MRPGTGLLRLLGLSCALALLAPLAPGASWTAMAVLGAAVLAASWEALALRGIAVTLERPGALALSLGEEETVALSLRTDSTRPLRVILRQTWPSLVETRASVLEGICRPGEVLRFDIAHRGIERGAATLPPAHIALARVGLIERIVAAGDPVALSVIPSLHGVGRLHARLNRYVLRGMGSRTAARFGKGREFERLREYVRDDDLRDVAWKASARHGKLIVREFRLDRSQDVIVCLDQGHRMAARVAQISRLDHAINAALLVAYICNRMEDRFSLLSFAGGVEAALPPGRGAAQLRRVTSMVTSLRSAYRHTDYLALAASLKARLRHRSLVLILTVLPEMEDHHSLLRAVKMMSVQHLPLVVALSDPDLRAATRILPADREELSRTLVSRDLWTSRQAVLLELRRLGALVVETDPGSAGLEAVNAYLDVKKRQIL